MLYEGTEVISIIDFVSLICKIDSPALFTEICSSFCSFICAKYSYEDNICLKAEYFDKTRHLLFSLDLVLHVFGSENIQKYISNEDFSNILNSIISKNYTITSSSCCCCPKKLKKAITHSTSFNQFVRMGEEELRKFNTLKSSIRFLICLDIEGKVSSFCSMLSHSCF
jgi:hypothetical protein